MYRKIRLPFHRPHHQNSNPHSLAHALAPRRSKPSWYVSTPCPLLHETKYIREQGISCLSPVGLAKSTPETPCLIHQDWVLAVPVGPRQKQAQTRKANQRLGAGCVSSSLLLERTPGKKPPLLLIFLVRPPPFRSVLIDSEKFASVLIFLCPSCPCCWSLGYGTRRQICKFPRPQQARHLARSATVALTVLSSQKRQQRLVWIRVENQIFRPLDRELSLRPYLFTT